VKGRRSHSLCHWLVMIFTRLIYFCLWLNPQLLWLRASSFWNLQRYWSISSVVSLSSIVYPRYSVTVCIIISCHLFVTHAKLVDSSFSLFIRVCFCCNIFLYVDHWIVTNRMMWVDLAWLNGWAPNSHTIWLSLMWLCRTLDMQDVRNCPKISKFSSAQWQWWSLTDRSSCVSSWPATGSSRTWFSRRSFMSCTSCVKNSCRNRSATLLFSPRRVPFCLRLLFLRGFATLKT